MREVINKFSKGSPVIIMDDFDRENEGDIVFSAQHITTKQIADILHYTSGIICVTMMEDTASKLGLYKMCDKNTDPNQTNFTISCDHISTSTGVSADDRLKTIKALIDDNSKSSDFTKPGHIFPLVCKNGLLKERKGHTESSVQLCLLSELKPVGVICELMNNDGTMMRYDDCKRLSETLNIPLISVKEIEEYSNSINFNHKIETKLDVSECDLHIKNYKEGFKLRIYKDPFTLKELPVLYKGNIREGMLLRIHSECLTGNVFHSMHCDCDEQLEKSIKMIYDKGGMVMYVGDHEGRGIGLFNKIKAYKLQANGEDTISANIKLGYKEDERDYSLCIRVLKEMGLTKIELITNNPEKIRALDEFSIRQISLDSNITNLNKKYLYTKVEKMSHDKKLISFIPMVNAEWDLDYNKMTYKEVCIVKTLWNKEYVDEMEKKVIEVLDKYDIKHNTYIVPGAYEIPLKCKKVNKQTLNKYDAFITLGVVIKGETMHFEYVSESVYKGIMDVQLQDNILIINGVLACLNKDQVEARVNSDMPYDLAKSALYLL